ncbi:MAG: putative 2OG-Fe(II) oxygenase [Pseudomonadota bacterium]|nr:putative 2OG-Fe(II) oxygenase [Pseudomonadota bacterium]
MSSPIERQAVQALEQGRIAEACGLFSQAAPHIRDPKSLFAAAVAFASGARFAEALGMLQRLDAGGEPRAESLNLRADICAQMGRDRDAAAIYGELLKRGHADDALHYKYAHSLFKAGAVSAAMDSLEPALRVKTAQIRAQAKLLRARCAAALGDYSQARTQLEKLLKNKDLDDTAQYRLARLALHCGDLTKAQTLLQAYMRKHPQVTAPKQALLLCHIYAGEAESASEIIQGLAEQNNDVETITIAADYLHEMQLDDVFEFWQRAWAHNHNPGVFRAYLTRLLVANNPSAARKLLDEYAGRYRQDGLWEWGQMSWLRHNGEYQQMLELATASDVQGEHAEAMCLAHFALGQYDRALAQAMTLNKQFPANQYFIAMLVTALRCLADPRYQQLVNYSTMVATVDLTQPPSEQSAHIDWQTLAEQLRAMHVMHKSPPLQSVRAGTQTPGNLFTAAQHPQLKQLAQRINAAAQLHFASVANMGLPQEHPLNLFRPKAPMLHASWSIQAQAETYHESHVHPKGWYSGTCYVEVPKVLNEDSSAGKLVFGEPPFVTKDKLEADGDVLPEVGKLVLFPSYFWHGTRSFAGAENRLVTAFDFGNPDCFV